MILPLDDLQKGRDGVHSCKYLLLLFKKAFNAFLQLGALGNEVNTWTSLVKGHESFQFIRCNQARLGVVSWGINRRRILPSEEQDEGVPHSVSFWCIFICFQLFFLSLLCNLHCKHGWVRAEAGGTHLLCVCCVCNCITAAVILGSLVFCKRHTDNEWSLSIYLWKCWDLLHRVQY